MKLCQEIGDMKLSEMAELFNVGSDSAASRSASRINGVLATDEKVRRTYNGICKDLMS